MQISLTSRCGFCRCKRKNASGGFTLVEMVITTAIIALLSTVVIVRYSTFDSTILLKSTAYEIAATLREAQVYSLSVLGSSGADFDTAYGIAFTPGTKEYQFFGFVDSDPYPYFGDPDSFKVREPDPIGRSIDISDVCINTSSGQYCSVDNIGELYISFRRPEFNALFDVETMPSGVDNDQIESAEIKVHSINDPARVWVVTVGLLGHISVVKE